MTVSELRCPLDDSPLRGLTYESDVDVERCATCQGVWLERGELERIQQSLQNDYTEQLRLLPDEAIRAFEMAKQEVAGSITCPKCKTKMEKREYGLCSQIIIDACPTCRGIWLNDGELQGLEMFFEHSRAATTEIRKGFLGSLLGFLGFDS